MPESTNRPRRSRKGVAPARMGAVPQAGGRDRGDLTQRAYDHLRLGILQGQFAEGSVISEASLARELGISRTPVGEAVRQLVGEGLMDQVPRFGTIVKAIGREELVELYEMREALEGFAAGRAAERISPESLRRLDEYTAVMARIARDAAAQEARDLDDATLRHFLAADFAFHMHVLGSAGNRRLLKAVHDMRTISRIFRLRRTRHSPRIVGSAAEHHRDILAALRGRDGERAGRLMSEHIRAGKVETLASLDREPRYAELGQDLELPPEVREELARFAELDPPGRAEGGAED